MGQCNNSGFIFHALQKRRSQLSLPRQLLRALTSAGPPCSAWHRTLRSPLPRSHALVHLELLRESNPARGGRGCTAESDANVCGACSTCSIPAPETWGLSSLLMHMGGFGLGCSTHEVHSVLGILGRLAPDDQLPFQQSRAKGAGPVECPRWPHPCSCILSRPGAPLRNCCTRVVNRGESAAQGDLLSSTKHD